MPLLSDYQNAILESIKDYDFRRILRMKGSCHSALVGRWIDWWLGQKIDGMVCNPARGSRGGCRRYFADLLFLELFQGEDCYEVKGVAEVENNREKFTQKIRSLASFEKYTRRGIRAYPDMEFAAFCYTIDIPEDVLGQKIYDEIFDVCEESELLWIVCEIRRSLSREKPDYCIHMPERARYTRNFSAVVVYSLKKAKQVRNITGPGIT